MDIREQAFYVSEARCATIIESVLTLLFSLSFASFFSLPRDKRQISQIEHFRFWPMRFADRLATFRFWHFITRMQDSFTHGLVISLLISD